MAILRGGDDRIPSQGVRLRFLAAAISRWEAVPGGATGVSQPVRDSPLLATRWVVSNPSSTIPAGGLVSDRLHLQGQHDAGKPPKLDQAVKQRWRTGKLLGTDNIKRGFVDARSKQD